MNIIILSWNTLGGGVASTGGEVYGRVGYIASGVCMRYDNMIWITKLYK